MKLFFIIFMFLLQTEKSCDNLPLIRSIFQTDLTEKGIFKIISICKESNCSLVTPYYAAATMKKAEFTWSPLKKLVNFKKGRDMLDNFILEYPNNLEARYVRYLTQKNVPSFLNYTQNLNEDYLFIIQNISKSNLDEDYQKTILEHIKKIQNE